MSGQHDAVAYTGDPTQSDDTFALDCTDSLDIQKPCDPSSSLAPGDIVQAPRSVVATLVRKSLFRLYRRQHLVGLLLDLDFQVPRYAVLHVMALKAGIVEQPLRKPLQWSKWFGSRRHGIDAATEAAQCKTKWDLEDPKAFLVRGDSSIADSSELLHSLDKARKCGELKAAGLLCGDSSEGCETTICSKFQRTCTAM